MCGPEKDRFFFWFLFYQRASRNRLASETVERTPLTFQCVNDVHGRDGLPLCVLRVGDCVANDVLEENLEYSSGLFVYQAGDSLDSSTASQTPDGGFGDALDVVSEHLAMTFGSSLAETLSSFASTRHDDDARKCVS